MNRINSLIKLIVVASCAVALTTWALAENRAVTSAAPQTINHQCPDALELNDTYDVATLLTPGQTQIATLDSGGLAGTHDKDWFTFSVAGGQSITLTTTVPPISVLTATEISLFTSAVDAANNTNPLTGTSGSLSWISPSTVTTQSLWALARNPYSAIQSSFCDAFYFTDLVLSGKIDNTNTRKTVITGTNRSVTYTISLYNAGQTLNDVLLIDHLPSDMLLTAININPASASIVVYTSTSAITWTGRVAQAGTVTITLSTLAGEATQSVENIVRIDAEYVFSRTSEAVTLPPVAPRQIFLPLLLRSQ